MYVDIEAQDEFIRTNYKATLRHTIEEEHLRYFPALKKSLREAVAPQATARATRGMIGQRLDLMAGTGPELMSETTTIERAEAPESLGDSGWALSRVKDPYEKSIAIIGRGRVRHLSRQIPPRSGP